MCEDIFGSENVQASYDDIDDEKSRKKFDGKHCVRFFLLLLVYAVIAK